MTTARAINDEQTALWNGPAGRAWVEAQELLDAMFRPFEQLLVAASAGVGQRVLDVGCGTGATTLAIARRLGADAQCLGVDLSAPMIELAGRRAREEASRARFLRADAQVHAFAPESFDVVVSRFGVMFFDDPVAAFTNLRRASRPGGKLVFHAFRSAAENPFMTTGERAAAPLLPNLPPRRPEGPGQFAFADRARVSQVLELSGWTNVDVRPLDITCSLREHDLVRYLTWLGPVGVALQQADAATRTEVVDVMRRAFQPYVQRDEVRFTAACWAVTAQN
jgi:SAM-dependent methyltransferase